MPIQLKRSAVAGKVPTTAQLSLGELAVNTHDGRMFLKRDNGSASIVEFGHAVPSGTKMLFAQSTAPTGWTKDTWHNNTALRVVSGNTGSGGYLDFTTAFAWKGVSGSVGWTAAGGSVHHHTLSWHEMPVHSHPQYVSANKNTGGTGIRQDWDRDDSGLTAYPQNINTGNAGGNWGHAHGFSGHNHNHSFTGTSIDLNVKYVDVIIATKS